MKKIDFIYYKSFIFFTVTSILLPLVILGGNVRGVLLCYLLITGIASFKLSIIILKTKPRIVEGIFYIFVYVFLGITPLIQINNYKYPWPGYYSDNLLFFAGVVIILGILGYEIGLYLGNKTNQKSLKLKQTKITINLPLLCTVSLISFLVSIYNFGGVGNLFLDRNSMNSLLEKTDLLISSSLLRVPVFISLCLIFLLLKKESKNQNKSKFILYILAVLFIILNIIASNPISTPRFWMGTLFLGVTFLIIKWGKNTILFIIAFTLITLLYIFPNADIFSRNRVGGIKLKSSGIIDSLATSGDFDAFQQLLNTIEFVSVSGISWGKQFLGTLFFWLPRSIWEGKPIGSGALVASGVGYDYTNLSSPMWAEFYINFGLLGVFILFILYGWICSVLQEKFIHALINNSININRIFIPIFSAYQLFLLRGELQSTFPYLVVILSFTILGSYKLKVKLIKRVKNK